jgi:hypothetical protein
MPSRPRKPWRVTLIGGDVRATSDHTSQRNAYDFLIAGLRGESPAEVSQVEQWLDGRWLHFETVRSVDLPSSLHNFGPRVEA